MNDAPMKLMLPLKYVNEQDKRALWLYFAIALLGAVCLASALFFVPTVGKKSELEHPGAASPAASPKPPSRNR